VSPTAVAADGGARDGAAIAKASFDVPVAAVAGGAGAALLASAAFPAMVLRRRRKADGADDVGLRARD